MQSVVADTHAAVWLLGNDKRLSKTAIATFDAAERILLPSICLVEITYLVEKRRLDGAVLPRLLDEFDTPGTALELAPLDLGVVLAMQDVPRGDVPDMPDRIIAATALHYRVPLITRDGKIRASCVSTVW